MVEADIMLGNSDGKSDRAGTNVYIHPSMLGAREPPTEAVAAYAGAARYVRGAEATHHAVVFHAAPQAVSTATLCME